MLATITLLLMAVTASPAPLPEAFDVTVGGVSFGAEEFHRTETPDGVSISGKVSLKIPGVGDAVLSQDTKLTRDGHPVSYTLDADVPEQQAVVRVVSTPTGYSMSVTAKGETTPARTQAVEVKTSVFLLDNNFASHIDVLTRGLGDLGSGEERAITVLVPQVMVALSATVKRGADGEASQGGVAVATRSYRVTFANIATDLIARAEDGALLQVEAAVQKAILKRRGFALAAEKDGGPPAAASDARETAIEVKGPAAALPATLLIPTSEARLPVVVFLSGSGPNDKDETIGPNKPFADIARGLGDRGIASLRFDKRTLAIKDASKVEGISLKEEYYDDAKAAIALVGAHPKLDGKRIFIVGHSEGAMVAPIAAAATPARGIVMMAPGVRPIDVVLVDQLSYGAKLTGLSESEIADQAKTITDAFKVIRDPKRTGTPPFMGASAAYWREFLALDVAKSVRDSKLPILVLQGDKDFQVRKDLDFELLKTRVGAAGGRVTYRSFPDLNHFFIKVEHESTGAEYGAPAHVEPSVIAAIADWILSR